MANTQFDNFGFNPDDLYLNPNETDLLIAALDSNKPEQAFVGQNPEPLSPYAPQGSKQEQRTRNASGQGTGSQHDSPDGTNGTVGQESNPYLDFDTSEGAWDWNLRSLPEHYTADSLTQGLDRKGSAGSDGEDDEDKQQSPEADEGEPGDKRKNSDDLDDEDGGGKRQETDAKNGRKQTQRPGRKPLTSEPTTVSPTFRVIATNMLTCGNKKRKAQNRAAQRAFRERKEQHVKNLETKVDELTKASEAANHENDLLKAQIDRLQTELKEFRRQMSLNSGANGGSPTFRSAGQPYSSRAVWDLNNNFNFEFPTFGRVTDGKLHSSPVSSANNRNNSPTVASPASISSHRSNSQSAARTSIDNDLSSLFTPDVLENAEIRSKPASQSNKSGSKDGRSPSTGVPPRRSADSNGASPASSGSNAGLTSSSCATTPEATCETPDQRKDTVTTANVAGKGDNFGSKEAFCKDFQTACGNAQNPVPLVMSNSSNEIPALTPALTSQSHDSSLDYNGFDWLANQNGGTFDPILFGDYREPQDNVLNSDFNFFNDAFPSLSEYSSPQSATQTQPVEPKLPKKKDLMQEIEEKQAGKEPEVVPGEERQQFLTCNLLWSV